MLGTIGRVVGELRRDVAAARERDPAAKDVSTVEILATWPGVHALLAHRVAHLLDSAGVPLVPRSIAQATRLLTGIEIHPAAEIGDGLFIDRGTGVVIGETAQVGDGVTIGPGAKLLGAVKVGDGTRIAPNAVVTHDIPANATVVGNPGHAVPDERRGKEGPDADWSQLPDPVTDALKSVSMRLAELERAVAQIAGARSSVPGDVVPLRPVRGPNTTGG